MAAEIDPSARSSLETRKLELEVERLKLEVASTAKLQRFELTLKWLPTLQILVTVLGFAFTIWQYRAEQARNRTATAEQAVKQSAERAEQARREKELSQREFMKPLLEKQQQLYFDAASAAATVASPASNALERRQAEARFWVLYWGPLVMVETTEVSGAMKNFGKCLRGEEKCSAYELQSRSLSLASTLEAAMLKTWNAKPDEFTTFQFDYRQSSGAGS
jgi:hypothetical protein